MNYYGTTGADSFTGTSSADYMWGDDGNDYLNGGAGYDYINGGRGNDTMIGGAGNDVFEYGQSCGGLNSGYDSIDGGADYDTIRIIPTSGYNWTAIQLTRLSGVESIENSISGQPGYINVNGNVDFSDVQVYTNITSISGQTGADTITGSSYFNGTSYLAENIFGGAGNDLLDGGAGANSLTGNSGADKFQISKEHDYSTIYDFTQGSDHVQFRSSLASSFSDLTITNDTLGYAHITSALTHDFNITVVGVSASALTSNDFYFVA